MIRRLMVVLAMVLAFGALATCSQFQPKYALPTPPEQGSLVILRGALVANQKGWSRILAGGAREDQIIAQVGRIVSPNGANLVGRSISGDIVVFNAPQPGRYQLVELGYVRQLNAGPFNLMVELPVNAPEQHPPLAFNLQPGQIHYVSTVVVRYLESYGSGTFQLQGIELRPDTGAEGHGEKAALTAVLADLDPRNPWRPVIEARLRTLTP